jgi:hypothetical protein
MNTNPQSKGVVTTEFWLVLLANLIAAALAHFEQIDAPWAVTAITILTGIYALLRAALKNKILDSK